MDIVSKGLSAVLGFLPDSPFKFVDDLTATGQIAEWLGFLNWFIPIYSFIGILEAWLVCIALYYVYQVALRWLNAIE